MTLLLGCALVAGCLPAPARRKVEGDIVRAISFDVEDAWLGERLWTGQTNLQLRSVMEQQQTAFGLMLPIVNRFVTPERLRPEQLERDAYRLEVWYAHRGWFDARFEGWAVHRVRPRWPRRAGIVDVRGFVDPGEPSIVRALDVAGQRSTTVDSLVRTTLRTSALDVGDQFDLDAVYVTRDALLERLANHGYPHATAEIDIVAFPEELAVDVELDLEPGPLSVYGPIRVQGNDSVPDRLVRATLPITRGERYDASELALTQRRLFGLGAFSLVNIQPDLSDPTATEVPILIDLTEAEFRTLRLGGGFEFDGANVNPRLSASFAHVNLFRRLVRFGADGSFGYAYTIGSGGVANGTATYSFGTSLEYPRLFREPLTLAVAVRYERDVQFRQFLFERPQVNATLSWRLDDDIVLRGGAHWERFELLGLDPSIAPAIARIYGWDFVEQGAYQLATVSAGVIIDWRDDPISPGRGSYWEARVRQSIPLVAGDFNYVDLSGELRGYRKISIDSPLTIAARGRAEWVRPWGDSPIPYPETVFLGGADGLRGFRDGQVGPYDVVCVPGDDGTTTARYLPVGGTFGALATVENRVDTGAGIPWSFVAPFVDVGALVPDVRAAENMLLRWNVGLGARYDSFIGPIRIDLAFRPTYSEDFGPQQVDGLDQYIGCPPEERRARRYDFVSLFKDRGARYSSLPPVAFQLHVAIGESF